MIYLIQILFITCTQTDFYFKILRVLFKVIDMRGILLN